MTEFIDNAVLSAELEKALAQIRAILSGDPAGSVDWEAVYHRMGQLGLQAESYIMIGPRATDQLPHFFHFQRRAESQLNQLLAGLGLLEGYREYLRFRQGDGFEVDDPDVAKGA